MEGMVKIDREILKGSLDIILLLLLEQKSMYGYQISKTLKTLSDNKLIIGEGTLYPALKRLEEQKYIYKYFNEDNQTTSKRKYYKITHEGKEQLKIKISDFFLIEKIVKDCRGNINEYK